MRYTEACGFGHSRKLRLIVLVRIFCVDRLAFLHFNRQTESLEIDGLNRATDQVHFNAALFVVVNRAMSKSLQIEVRAEFAVDA